MCAYPVFSTEKRMGGRMGFSNSPEQAKRMTELCQKMVTWNASRIEAELRSKEEAQREGLGLCDLEAKS